MNAPTPSHDPNPLDEAVAAFQGMAVPPRPVDDAWLVRTAAGPSPTVEFTLPSRRRMMMRLATLSAAAVLAAVGTIFLAGTTSVALADVVKAAEGHKLVKYSMSQGVETKDGSSVQPLVVVAYADLRTPRFRTDNWAPGGLQGAIDFESIFIQDGVNGVTMHRITEVVTEKGKTDPDLIKVLKDFEHLGVPRKTVTLFDLQGDMTPATANKSKPILENLRELEKHKDAVATKTKFRGVDVLKYRIEEGLRTTILLVDAATKLPVRLEYESTDPRDLDPSTTSTKYVFSDFEWDPQLKGFKDVDALFNTTPPAGYKVEDRRKKAGKTGQ